MKEHRCKLPNLTTYRAGVVFTCDCGRTYVLSVSWVERLQLRQPSRVSRTAESNSNDMKETDR